MCHMKCSQYSVVSRHMCANPGNNTIVRVVILNPIITSLSFCCRSVTAASRDALLHIPPLPRAVLAVISVTFYLIPILLLCYLHMRIYGAATHSSKNIRRSSQHQLIPMAKAISANGNHLCGGEDSTTATSSCNSKEQKILKEDNYSKFDRISQRTMDMKPILQSTTKFNQQHLSKNRRNNMSQQHKPSSSKPKPIRKCSFSSFNECRFVADGGKTKTFLFSANARASATSHEKEQRVANENRRKVSALSNGSNTSSSSLVQAARRMSGRMSTRALSIYHFFNEKEELRAAKIAGVVLVIALVCWTPFVIVMGHLAWGSTDDKHFNAILSRSADPTVFWTHFVYSITSLLFAAITPYIYVFRSKKVQKSLCSVLGRHVLCCLGQRKPPRKPRTTYSPLKGKERLRCQSVCYLSTSETLKTSNKTSSAENLQHKVLSSNKRWRSTPDLRESSSDDLANLEVTEATTKADDTTCCDKVKKSASSALKKLVIKPEDKVVGAAGAKADLVVNVKVHRSGEAIRVSRKPRLISPPEFPKGPNSCIQSVVVDSKLLSHKSGIVSSV